MYLLSGPGKEAEGKVRRQQGLYGGKLWGREGGGT